jgi:hypothetical protein
MARPPQFAYDQDDPASVAAVKAMAKRLSPEDRANLMAWLALYYDDRGEMFSTQTSRRRKRIVLEGEEFWLLRVRKL